MRYVNFRQVQAMKIEGVRQGYERKPVSLPEKEHRYASIIDGQLIIKTDMGATYDFNAAETNDVKQHKLNVLMYTSRKDALIPFYRREHAAQCFREIRSLLYEFKSEAK